mmetsp:Transcript_22780/g.33639  ORF Transcript_22780/g.33639 Transcript_22780/m.33639 type:complete len:187 (-) Transcript_22780:157-717(-)
MVERETLVVSISICMLMQLHCHEWNPNDPASRIYYGEDQEQHGISILFDLVQNNRARFNESSPGVHSERTKQRNIVIAETQTKADDPMHCVSYMAHHQAVQNIHHEVWHTPKDTNTFVEYRIITIVQADYSKTNCNYVVKGMEAIPSGKFLFLRLTVQPTTQPQNAGNGEGQPRLFGSIVVLPETG